MPRERPIDRTKESRFTGPVTGIASLVNLFKGVSQNQYPIFGPFIFSEDGADGNTNRPSYRIGFSRPVTDIARLVQIGNFV